MGIYSFKISCSRPAGGLPASPGVTRHRATFNVKVTAEDAVEAKKIATSKAKGNLTGWDHIRVLPVRNP